MLASFPVSMLNQKPSDLGIPNRFKLDPSRSRANFLAHLAARDAAEADLLFALVGAHAVVDAAERRTRASFAMPSLVGTRQGLRELLSLRSEAVWRHTTQSATQRHRCSTVSVMFFRATIDIVTKHYSAYWMPTADLWPD
jgi:hypothetical protein